MVLPFQKIMLCFIVDSGAFQATFPSLFEELSRESFQLLDSGFYALGLRVMIL